MLNSSTPDRLPIGSQLGPYQIEAFLGAGGMGQVYRARDTRLHRPVAIKVLPPAARNQVEQQSRFLQEARAVSALNHPNIVILHDIAIGSGLDFLVMEYVHGTTLKELTRTEGLLHTDVVIYGVQIAEALAAAHDVGIVHRDIKPANIIITPESRVKVLDFGVAKLMERIGADRDATDERPTALTSPGMVVGTVSYMSPEQTRAQPLDGRSDIFSLGCVLYEAATGRLPFQGLSALAIMHEIATVDPPIPSELKSDLTPQFDHVIARSLAKDKNERYASALEFANALRGLEVQPTTHWSSKEEREADGFVGRELELHRLQELLQQARTGAGKIVFLTGEPGIGKSALAAEFSSYVRRLCPDMLVGQGSCIEHYGASEAYLPFLDALSGLLAGVHGKRVLAVLRRHAPTWCLQFPAAFPSSDAVDQLQREVIGATKERMIREFGDAVAALASTSPVLLLLEDLHWADPSTIDLIRHLAPRLARQRLLLLATLRPDDMEREKNPIRNCQREIQAHNWCEDIPLCPLESTHISSYLESRFSPNNFPSELGAVIYKKTEGHPLFWAALIQFLAERKDIIRLNSHWSLSRPIAELDLEVPESVRGMIRRKIEILEDQDRQALQYASVEGEEFTSTVVAAVLGTDDLALEQRLAKVERTHGLIEMRGEDELPDGTLAIKYRFVHALYQNVLYEDLISKHRVLLHRQIGEQLERHYGGQTPRFAAALADHFERGREYARAIEYLIQAADVATDRYASAAAEGHQTHALRLAEKLAPETREAKKIKLFHKRGSTRLSLGSLNEAENDFMQMLELARHASDLEAESIAMNALANPFLFLDSRRGDEMTIRAEEALRVAEQSGNPALRAEAMVNLAMKHSVLGEPATAKALFEAAIPIARSCGRDQTLLTTVTHCGIGHFFQTEYAKAEKMLSEALNLASQLNNGGILVSALFFLGMTQASLGRISDGLRTLNKALEMAKRNSDVTHLRRAPNGIRWVHRELQDFNYTIPRDRPEIETQLWINLIHEATHGGGKGQSPEEKREAEAIYDRNPWTRYHFSGVRVQAGAAEYSLSEGDLDGASARAHELLDNSIRHGPPKYIVIAHKLLAEVAMVRGDVARAERELFAAINTFHTHPSPLVEWKTYTTLGRLYRSMKRPQDARQAFARAAEIVKTIASTIGEEQLRSTFLSSAAVREVMVGSDGYEESGAEP